MGISLRKARKLAGATEFEPVSREDKNDTDIEKLIIADDVAYWRSGVKASRQGILYYAAKRAIDILFAMVFIIVGFPWLVVCGLLMQREAPGPIFYKQRRVGRYGKIISVLKLRSMPVDAEGDGPQLSPINGDKRCGPVGKFIRKAKIDELPQFWNVLIGEISVVGPRPERPFFVDRFTEEFPLFPLRHMVKPGLTGLAQINEKDAFKMRDKLRYDLFYVRKYNLALDLKILWLTAVYCFKCLFSGFKDAGGGQICANSR
jgi:lipopolysaccharide/colanic/teichoic acid biosynthesis glycosyltransferase